MSLTYMGLCSKVKYNINTLLLEDVTHEIWLTYVTLQQGF